eukprot:TRINITY_DN27485_c0_g1_i1.p1 TRINITY_DN27485_c0_g1~~TRINITY_DN27485_c0_g1_i1.p1  ORF type:complete len:314 (+),score=80.57 TRINITY_DN27485_c0_g1_i1:50-991(+)
MDAMAASQVIDLDSDGGTIAAEKRPPKRRRRQRADPEVVDLTCASPGGKPPAQASAAEVVDLTAPDAGRTAAKPVAAIFSGPAGWRGKALPTLLPPSPAPHPAATAGIPGMYQFTDFITPAEEGALLADFDSLPWYFGTNRDKIRSARWGVFTDFGKRAVTQGTAGASDDDLPPCLAPLRTRLLEQNRPWSGMLQGWIPNEGNANEYVSAQRQSLTDHFDDRALSGPIVAMVSLLGRCDMTFLWHRGHTQPQIDRGAVSPRPPIKVHMPPRSLTLLTGQARYDYTHGIRAEDFPDPRRYSVVFRQAKLTDGSG